MDVAAGRRHPNPKADRDHSETSTCDRIQSDLMESMSVRSDSSFHWREKRHLPAGAGYLDHVGYFTRSRTPAINRRRISLFLL